MDYQERIGKAIVRLRAARGVSQEKMALEAKIDRRYMSDIENGKRNISIDILSRIAAEEHAEYNESNDSLKEWLVDQGYEDAIVLESPTYRNAVLGISEDGRVIYSERIIIEDMVVDEGMDIDDAFDNFSYNLLRALPYMGEKAPIILHDILI